MSPSLLPRGGKPPSNPQVLGKALSLARCSFYLVLPVLPVDPSCEGLPSFPVSSWQNARGQAPRDTQAAHVRGAAWGTAKPSSAPPPWLIPSEQHILLQRKAEVTLTEYDGNVNALPINSTGKTGRAYVCGAVLLFFLKCTTPVPILQTENQGPAGTHVWWERTWKNQIKCF